MDILKRICFIWSLTFLALFLIFFGFFGEWRLLDAIKAFPYAVIYSEKINYYHFTLVAPFFVAIFDLLTAETRKTSERDLPSVVAEKQEL